MTTLLEIFHKNGMLMTLQEWIIENKDILSIRSIEKQVGIPSTTLKNVIHGKQNIPKKWVNPLYYFLKSRIDDFPISPKD